MSYYNSDYNNYANSNSPSQIQQLQPLSGGSPLPGYTTLTHPTDQKQQSFNLQQQQQSFNLQQQQQQQQQQFNYQQQQQRLNSPIMNNYISLSNYNTNNNSNNLISSSASSSISSSSGYQPLSLSTTNTSINSFSSNTNKSNNTTNNNSSTNLSINTRARFMCSKGFELEDDIEFCPDIQLNITTGNNNNNNNNGKFNPYTSITFSPNGSTILPATPTMDHSSLLQVDLNPSDVLSKTTVVSETTTTTPTNEIIRPSSPSSKNFTPRAKKILEIVNPHTGLRVGSPILRNNTLINNANNNNTNNRSETPTAS